MESLPQNPEFRNNPENFHQYTLLLSHRQPTMDAQMSLGVSTGCYLLRASLVCIQ